MIFTAGLIVGAFVGILASLTLLIYLWNKDQIMSQHKQTIQHTITLLQQAKHLLEKELQYDYSVTDEIENIIESLEFDAHIMLGEEE